MGKLFGWLLSEEGSEAKASARAGLAEALSMVDAHLSSTCVGGGGGLWCGDGGGLSEQDIVIVPLLTCVCAACRPSTSCRTSVKKAADR